LARTLQTVATTGNTKHSPFKHVLIIMTDIVDILGHFVAHAGEAKRSEEMIPVTPHFDLQC
jgi:hypothetical protein